MASNPFRKKGSATDTEPGSVPTVSTPAAFLESITSPAPQGDPARGRPPQKAKVVKRVRVVSPPPLSPDSPEAPNYGGGGGDGQGDATRDLFESRFPEHPGHVPEMPEAAPLVAANQSPANPFNQSLSVEEVEHDKEMATTASAPGKGAMDVNAFQRLLLTGQSGTDAVVPPAAKPLALTPQSRSDTDSDTDSTSSATSVEVPSRASHEDMNAQGSSHTDAPVPGAGLKKAPPPPSSRHGKLISKNKQKEDAGPNRPSSSSSSTSSAQAKPSSDVNKPLPPAPRGNGMEEESEDIFAREAAGKVPEHDGPAPAGPVASTGTKRQTPAPPPRRGHARAESKHLSAPDASNAGNAGGATHDDPQPRSSVDSQRSGTDSITGRQVPAPPPPRRPGAPHRHSSQFSASFASPLSPSASDSDRPPPTLPTEHDSAHFDTPSREQTPISGANQQKSSRPLPPPQRNASVRRSAARSEPPRRMSSGNKENGDAPPPPPPRNRGGGRGGEEGPSPARRASVDSVASYASTNVEIREDSIAEEEAVADAGKGADILADLDALQREVDALRGQERKSD